MAKSRAPAPEVAEDGFSATSAQMLFQKLPRQSLRWLHTSASLYTLLVLESPRSANYNNLLQFLEMIHWRAHDKVTADEFSVLFSEWMQLLATVPSTDKSPVNSSSSTTKKKVVYVPLAMFRAALLEKSFGEAEIDLFIGITLNEFNQQQLLHQALAFHTHKVSVASPTTGSLEVVTRRWIGLTEELFFTLDTPGYGAWSFDESCFFVSVLLQGAQRWESAEDVDADFNTLTLNLLTLQFLRDCGLAVSLAPQASSSALRKHAHSSAQKQRRTALHGSQSGGHVSSNNNSSNKQPQTPRTELTLLQLQRWLLRLCVTERDLQQLARRMAAAVEGLVRHVRAVAGPALPLLRACVSLEHRSGEVWGAPRLWEAAVLGAAGLTSLPEGGVSPALGFLLSSEANALASQQQSLLRLWDLPLEPDAACAHSDGLVFLDAQATGTPQRLQQASAAALELKTLAQRLSAHFALRWSQIPQTQTQTFPESCNEALQSLALKALYRLKSLSLLYIAALGDLAQTQMHSDSGFDSDPDEAGSLRGLCARILPSESALRADLEPQTQTHPVSGESGSGSGYDGAAAAMSVHDLMPQTPRSGSPPPPALPHTPQTLGTNTQTAQNSQSPRYLQSTWATRARYTHMHPHSQTLGSLGDSFDAAAANASGSAATSGSSSGHAAVTSHDVLSPQTTTGMQEEQRRPSATQTQTQTRPGSGLDADWTRLLDMRTQTPSPQKPRSSSASVSGSSVSSPQTSQTLGHNHRRSSPNSRTHSSNSNYNSNNTDNHRNHHHDGVSRQSSAKSGAHHEIMPRQIQTLGRARGEEPEVVPDSQNLGAYARSADSGSVGSSIASSSYSPRLTQKPQASQALLDAQISQILDQLVQTPDSQTQLQLLAELKRLRRGADAQTVPEPQTDYPESVSASQTSAQNTQTSQNKSKTSAQKPKPGPRPPQTSQSLGAQLDSLLQAQTQTTCEPQSLGSEEVTPGQVAQVLRGILRQMSSNNSNNNNNNHNNSRNSNDNANGSHASHGQAAGRRPSSNSRPPSQSQGQPAAPHSHSHNADKDGRESAQVQQLRLQSLEAILKLGEDLLRADERQHQQQSQPPSVAQHVHVQPPQQHQQPGAAVNNAAASTTAPSRTQQVLQRPAAGAAAGGGPIRRTQKVPGFAPDERAKLSKPARPF